MIKISSFYKYIFGTVRIKLYGEYCERLINVIAANGISFYSLKRRENFLEVTVLKDDFKKLRKLRKYTCVKIKINNKRGLPFLIRRYRQRYGILVGAVMFFVILNLMSTRMWMIKVEGNISVPKEEIMSTLEGLGVYEGISMDMIDVDVLKQQIVAKRQDIAWASLNKQGSVLEVNVTEVNGEKETIQECNLVAAFDGVIKHIDVQSGTVAVKVGDTVTKGQLLVSGMVDYGSGVTFTSAKGKIIAHTTSREKVEIGILNETEILNGDNKNRYVFEFLGCKIPLFLGSVRGKYNLDIYNSQLTMFGKNIPVSLTKISYTGKNIYYEELSINSAKNLIKDKIYKIYERNNNEILSITNEKITKENDKYIYSATVDYLSNICAISPIFYQLD